MEIHVEYALSQALVAGGQAGNNTRSHIDAAISALAGLEDNSARTSAVIWEINKRMELLDAYEGDRARGNLAAQLAVLMDVVKEIPALATDLSIATSFRLAIKKMPGIHATGSRATRVSARAAA